MVMVVVITIKIKMENKLNLLNLLEIWFKREQMKMPIERDKVMVVVIMIKLSVFWRNI